MYRFQQRPFSSLESIINASNASSLNLTAAEVAAAAAAAAVAAVAAVNVTENVFLTNRTDGYNCSERFQGVGRISTAQVYATTTAMDQATYHQYPRSICPHPTDADGLRFLYPDCDELLGCEVLGGGENFDYLVSTNGTGPDACTRWMGPLSAADATDKFQNFSGPEYMYTPAPRGRLIADEVCAEPFTTVSRQHVTRPAARDQDVA